MMDPRKVKPYRNRKLRQERPDPDQERPICLHCGTSIWGRVIACGDVLLHPHCLTGWRRRTTLPLVQLDLAQREQAIEGRVA